jgi:hypothetical protein
MEYFKLQELKYQPGEGELIEPGVHEIVVL